MNKVLLSSAIVMTLHDLGIEPRVFDMDYNDIKAMNYKPTPPHVKNGRGKRKAWKK